MRRTFLFACIVYVMLSGIIFPYVRWYADNPDTFQYLEIAKKYLSGDWSHAVNGYWSPMISWLLALPLLIFNDGLLAFKVTQYIIGVFVFYQWFLLLGKTNIVSGLKNILLFAAIPFIIDYSLLNCTPDLLFMGLLFLLMNLFIGGNVFSDAKKSMQAGIAGGILFLTKSFGLPFFIVISIVVLLIQINRKEKITSKNIVALYGTFLCISLIWILPLSFHYGEFTISRAASFNMSRDVAPLPGRSAELPILGSGLNEPQPNCKSAWETPGEYVSSETINIFHSTGDYLKIIERNILTIWYFDFRNQVGIVFLLLLILFISFKGYKELLKQKWIIIFLLFIVFIYGGYSLILVHTRYVWICSLLMLVLSVYFISQIISSGKAKIVLQILIAGILLLAMKRPYKEIMFTNDRNYPAFALLNSVKHPFETLWIMYRSDREIQKVVEDLHTSKQLSGNVASLKVRGLDRDPYTSSMRIALADSTRYFGQLDDQLSIADQEKMLAKNKIEYLVTWKNTEWGNSKPVYFNEAAGVRVYRVN